MLWMTKPRKGTETWHHRIYLQNQISISYEWQNPERGRKQPHLVFLLSDNAKLWMTKPRKGTETRKMWGIRRVRWLWMTKPRKGTETVFPVTGKPVLDKRYEWQNPERGRKQLFPLCIGMYFFVMNDKTPKGDELLQQNQLHNLRRK